MEGPHVESEHVHRVYSQIAKHFSDTRYKPWPRIAQFLTEQPPGSVIADVGCGNGKYLGVNPHVFALGCDICPELVAIAHCKSHEVAVCDCLALPYRSDQFDAVICIAVIHHLSTEERRLRALRELARITRPGGRLLVYVWALEQERRKFGSQDVMVPWHLQPKYAADHERSKVKHRAAKPRKQRKKKKDKRSSQRESKDTDSLEQQGLHCDLHAEDGSESDSMFLQDLLTVLASSGEEEEQREERVRERPVSCTNVDKDTPQLDNSSTISFSTGSGNNRTETPSTSNPVLTHTDRVPPETAVSQPLPHTPNSPRTDLSATMPEQKVDHLQGHVGCGPATAVLPDPSSPDPSLEGLGYKTFQRYYHVFRHGELSTLVSMVTGLEVVEEFYDHENWCVVAGKTHQL